VATECTYFGAFAELQKVTISFVMSVHLSLHLFTMNNSAPTEQLNEL